MQVTYSDNAKKQEGRYSLLQDVTNRFHELIGKTAENANLEWDKTADAQGRTQYILRIVDGPDSASVNFEPDELESPNRVEYLLYWLWGDLLQERNHRQFRRLEDMDGTED